MLLYNVSYRHYENGLLEAKRLCLNCVKIVIKGTLGVYKLSSVILDLHGM